jgi:hypothetical protein
MLFGREKYAEDRQKIEKKNVSQARADGSWS